MASKYVDINSVIQVIGNVFSSPHLLNATDKYIVREEDFSDKFHKIVFGAIYKIYQLGASEISLKNINDFLSSRPKSLAVYQKNKGDEWLLRAADVSTITSFDYYYGRLKKMSLLRAYDQVGVDVSDIYDPDNLFDTQKKQKQEEYLDNTPIVEIANKVAERVEIINEQYISNSTGEAYQAGNGVFDLIERYKKHPEVGVPLFGAMMNSVTRGARLRKFYLRSAPTGKGKTRSLVADACTIGCTELYNPETNKWEPGASKEPTLFIATEQDLEEIQSLMLAFIADVDEEHILNGKYYGDEEERVLRAAQIMVESPLYVEELPDFSLGDIEICIKKNIREHQINYIMLDYIRSSLKILADITKQTGGVKLREDNVLFMLSARLKEICNTYGVFIFSATQLSGDFNNMRAPDQSLLRGAICALIYLILLASRGLPKGKLTGKPKSILIW